MLKETSRNNFLGSIADVLKPVVNATDVYALNKHIPLIGGQTFADLSGLKGTQSLAEDMSYGAPFLRNTKNIQTTSIDPRVLDVAATIPMVGGATKLASNLGKNAFQEAARQIETGTGLLGRNTINPRMNIIKDPGGMLIGGERDLNNELLSMKINERPGATFESINSGTAPKDPHAVALNNWVDTKVKKYLRNQAGTESDPILKTIDSGVEYNFSPVDGNSKYHINNRRKYAGKPEEGMAKSDLGKDWEYRIDSIFKPSKAQDIKDILNNRTISGIASDKKEYQNAADRYNASILRMEHDLPIHNASDLEALKLIHQIPDENVYSLYSDGDITRKLGLNHVSDILYEDLDAGRLTLEQLNQMSIEKAIRRTAEYDAQKAKEMANAEADRIKGLPVHKEYNDNYKWIELKHPTNDNITKEALESEGNQMGHCVGSSNHYYTDVINGDTKIISLRDANNKPHVTLELNRKPLSFGDVANVMGQQNASALLDQIHASNGTTKDFANAAREIYPELDSYDIKQVKGKENQKPISRYQPYISDFIKNPTVSGGYDSIHELYNTDLMSAKDVKSKGPFSYEHGTKFSDNILQHPIFDKATELAYPTHSALMKDIHTVPEIEAWADQNFVNKKEFLHNIMSELQNKNMPYFTTDDLLKHIEENHLPKSPTQGFADGGKVTEKDPRHGGLKATNYPNPYGLRTWQDEAGIYHGQMMPKTSGWAGEIPAITPNRTITEFSLGGGNINEPFFPMVYKDISPNHIEVIKDYEAGLRDDSDPLVQEVKDRARQKAQQLVDQNKSPFKDYN